MFDWGEETFRKPQNWMTEVYKIIQQKQDFSTNSSILEPENIQIKNKMFLRTIQVSRKI